MTYFKMSVFVDSLVFPELLPVISALIWLVHNIKPEHLPNCFCPFPALGTMTKMKLTLPDIKTFHTHPDENDKHKPITVRVNLL